MMDEKIKVTIDAAAIVAAKIKTVAKEYDGRYALNDEAYRCVLSAYKKLRKIALMNDGDIKSIDIKAAEAAKITAEVPEADLYREGLDLFSELLAIVDSFDVSASENEGLIIEIGVTGLWKAV